MMSIETVTTFLALLAVATQVSLLLCLLMSPSVKGRGWLRGQIGPFGQVGAASVATVATLGSLYFSEVAHFMPCKWCWFQRAAMYPCAVILVIAVVKKDGSVRPYVGALAFIGALIALYHVLLERFPSLDSGTCDPTNPCTLIWLKKFGYLTIPGMALTGFVAIMVLLALQTSNERHQQLGHSSGKPQLQ
jgi:disulfide bond formation protein DsbB